MRFFGQPHILQELDLLIPQIQAGLNTNVLLSGPSGHGKTSLAYLFFSMGGFWDQTQISGPPDFYFDPDVRFHFLDEIHELETPETLYALLDTGRYTVILATNETGKLKDPLFNRCIYNFVLHEYSHDELLGMADWHFTTRGFESIDRMILEFCVDRSAGVPRLLRNICYRLSAIFKSRGIPQTTQELDTIVRGILDITEGGLDASDRAYVDFLREHGRTSLGLISAVTGLTVDTITKIIEPKLIRAGKLRITSRGREIIE